ncbi:MAG: ATP-binding protein [Candidatus Cloacimonetes bacterium]|nr:ATP-binding protein [Candidatus Cloacimonadota bacterium]
MKIAIASGKGGTGKTTLSVNLALYMQQSQDVVLCDLDVEEPDAHVFIGGERIAHQMVHKVVPEVNESACTACGLCREVCAFHAITLIAGRVLVFPELCHSCHACIELCPQQALLPRKVELGEITEYRRDRLRFVEARLLVGQEQAVPLIREAQRYIDQNAPASIVIYDAPPGTSCPVVQTLYDADYAILVTEPTPFGLHDLGLAAETVRLLGKPLGVVINKDDGDDNDIVRWCESEGVPLLARIPHKRSLAGLCAGGHTLFDADPDVARAIADVSTAILSMQEGGDA